MSWRHGSLALLLALSCAPGKMTVKKGEPQTAREKMLAEEKANKDKDPDARPPGSKKWSGWRYQGDRKECFFIVGRKCFKTEKAACSAARCKSPSKCENDGGGPATISCSGAPKATEATSEPEREKKPAKKSKRK
jgi:hypothetical protein